LDFNLVWHEKAIDDLKKIDRTKAKEIIEKVKGYLIQDPMKLGKPLYGEFKGLYRFRFGSFRIIYAADEKQGTLTILKIGHRKDVYKR